MERAKWHQYIHEFMLAATLLSMPLAARINSLCIVLLAINWMLTPDWGKKATRFKENWKLICALAAIFIVQVISVAWTTDVARVPPMLETRLGLLVLPVIIGTSRLLDLTAQLRQMTVFVFGCVLAGLVCHTDALLRLNAADLPISDLFSGYYTYSYLVKVIGINPIYMAMYLVWGIFLAGFVLDRCRYLLPKWQKWGLRIIITYLVFFLLHLGARMGVISFLVLGGVLLVNRLVTGARFARLLIGSGAALGLLVVVFFFSERSERFVNMFEPVSEKYPEVAPPMSELPLRGAIWYASWEVIQSAPVTGHGLGDVTALQQSAYQKYNFEHAHERKLNMHNQYLDQWAVAGLLGLLATLLYIIVPLRLAIKRHYPIYMVFVLLVAITFLTENVLSTQRGVVFVAFFQALLAFNDPGKARKDLADS